MNTIVRVCPERDIECGRNPDRWCATCKNHGERLKTAVNEYVESVKNSGPIHASTHVNGLAFPSLSPKLTGRVVPRFKADHAWRQSEAYLEIKALIEAGDMENVLAKIRKIIALTTEKNK